jgi:hypothetical protein
MDPSKKRACTGNGRSKEWVKSTYSEDALNVMVFDGILSDQVTTAWCPAASERYPNPRARQARPKKTRALDHMLTLFTRAELQ